jgi:hypothetical protein
MIRLPPALLTPHQEAIAARVLGEESARRRHLVVSLSGAHAYGFPSPDSDLDLKGIHIEPTSGLVGLELPPLHADRMEIIEGVEIDYTSNELGAALHSILKGNGNYIERVLGSLLPVQSPELDELKPLVRRSLSRRIFTHYRGFATSQLKATEDPKTATAKKVLYVLRTTLTGAHALATGEVQADVTRLFSEYGFEDARALVVLKQTGERVPLPEPQLSHWRARLAEAFRKLELARERSPLPEEPPNTPELQRWLLDLRRRLFD